jgi:hypothetical protein
MVSMVDTELTVMAVPLHSSVDGMTAGAAAWVLGNWAPLATVVGASRATATGWVPVPDSGDGQSYTTVIGEAGAKVTVPDPQSAGEAVSHTVMPTVCVPLVVDAGV